MRILSITAGAAGMYCGSCLRDNALAAELMARGHDVTLVPVYTPTLTDEPMSAGATCCLAASASISSSIRRSFARLPRFLDRLWDSPRLIGMFAGRADLAGCPLPRRDDDLDAAG